MRFLALTPFIALAAATFDLGALKTLCSPMTATDTLWLADDSAYPCAPLSGKGALGVTVHHCITAPTAELKGKKDTCASAADCGDDGVCVDLGSKGMRRVCWSKASGRDCQAFSSSS